MSQIHHDALLEPCSVARTNNDILKWWAELPGACGKVTRSELDIVEAGQASYINNHILFGCCLEYLYPCGCPIYTTLSGKLL